MLAHVIVNGIVSTKRVPWKQHNIDANTLDIIEEIVSKLDGPSFPRIWMT